MESPKKRFCTDCDYCGEIRMVEDDGHGGKVCSSCLSTDLHMPVQDNYVDHESISDNDKSDGSKLDDSNIDELLKEAYGPNAVRPPQ